MIRNQKTSVGTCFKDWYNANERRKNGSCQKSDKST